MSRPDPSRPYVLPIQIGMEETLGDELLAWTSQFRKFFVKVHDDFSSRPQWLPGIDPFEWYDEGYRIVHEMRLQFPTVHVKPGFAHYVFSVNERREGMGLPPVRLPNEVKAGHISVSDLLRSAPESQREQDERDAENPR
ncbi:hypothetical protein [Rhodococcus erythropolis]|uniref:hypothetical protein n=1 Tax=Rhodococcus erythropolis TaxID=1833 RepID=UPI0008AA7E33|nr:hypothetical protein [Rhodococcus erythropolis]OFV78570.1 hypothetical protein RERY_07020 [Rhodococcus erythropolis]